MNKILLTAVLLGASSTFALAADLPSRRAPPVYVPPIMAPAFTWTGMYAGINAGYAFDGHASYTNFAGPAVPAFVRTNANGFTGGGQIGYNVQLGGGIPVIGQLGGVFGNGGATGGLVVGVEADAAYTDLRAGFSDGFTAFRTRTDYVGTARGRVGYAFGDLLIFGTGGFAYGGVRSNIAGLGVAGGSDTIRTGYAYGGGLEYAIPTTSFVNFFHSSAVTLKAEFIHYDLGTSNFAVTNGAGVGYNSRVKTEGNLVRAGINYKLDLFGSPMAAPVVARY